MGKMLKMNKNELNFKCQSKNTNTQFTLRVKSKWLNFLWKKVLFNVVNRQLIRVKKKCLQPRIGRFKI